MVCRSTVSSTTRRATNQVTGSGGGAGGSSFTDIYASVNSDLFIDFNNHVYVERSGALNTLTPATVGGPVGTIADRTGTYIFRAPSDGARMTLRALSNGMQYLERSSGQYYVSDDAASTWKYLHDGTAYSVAAGVKASATDDPDEFCSIFSTYSGSSAQVGAEISHDNRTVYSGEYTWRYDVARGQSGVFAVNYTGATVPLANRPIPILLSVDPDNATANNRLAGNYLGFEWKQNSASGLPSASDPSGTLTIGARVGGGTTGTGNLYGLIIYQGTWTSEETETIRNFFDVDNREYYQVTSSAANISGQQYDYESFPMLHRKSNGNLIAAWRGGDTHLSIDGVIRVVESSDGGTTWSDIAAISQSSVDLRDPNGIILPNGDIILAAGVKTAPDNGPSQNVYKSTDGGSNWTLIENIPAPSGYNRIRFYGNMHRLADGTILAPAHQLEDDNTTWLACIYESTDSGETWSLRSEIGTGINETSIINLGGSNWLAVCREGTGSPVSVHYSTSTDDCETWTTPVDSNLEGVSPALIKVEESIYCLVGDRSGTGGVRLLAWSNGKLWEVSIAHLPFTAAAADTDVGYPAAVVSGNSVSMICYDESASQADPGIFFMKFNLPNFETIF